MCSHGMRQHADIAPQIVAAGDHAMLRCQCYIRASTRLRRYHLHPLAAMADARDFSLPGSNEVRCAVGAATIERAWFITSSCMFSSGSSTKSPCGPKRPSLRAHRALFEKLTITSSTQKCVIPNLSYLSSPAFQTMTNICSTHSLVSIVSLLEYSMKKVTGISIQRFFHAALCSRGHTNDGH